MRRLFALLLLSACLAGQDPPTAPVPQPPSPPEPEAPSRWYLERGTQVRAPGALDPVPDVAFQLALLLQDGRVPGFYDGQFAGVAGRFDDLAALASSEDVNHVVRVLAVMALQEASSGEPLAAALEPLVMPAHEEIDVARQVGPLRGGDGSPEFQRLLERANLSEHARFSLAKDGQPALVLAKIREMEAMVRRRMAAVLDPRIDSERDPFIDWYRQLVFDIGYHYQQFDDYGHATEWFHLLTDELPGHRETRMAHYNLACIDALQGRQDRAMAHLLAASEAGFGDAAWMLRDGDLQSLRERADFQSLAERLRRGGPAPGDPGSLEPSAPPGRAPGTADPPEGQARP